MISLPGLIQLTLVLISTIAIWAVLYLLVKSMELPRVAHVLAMLAVAAFALALFGATLANLMGIPLITN